MDYLKQINWVDIFVVIFLIRICYIAVKTGFPTELFKLLGTVLAIFLACHYYGKVGVFLNSHISLGEGTWVKFFDFLGFLILAFVSYFLLAIIRKLLLTLIKMETISQLNRWLALFLGIARGALFVSLLMFICVISNNNYFKDSLKSSLLGPMFFKVMPGVYSGLWKCFMFYSTSKPAFNQAVFDVVKGLLG